MTLEDGERIDLRRGGGGADVWKNEKREERNTAEIGK